MRTFKRYHSFSTNSNVIRGYKKENRLLEAIGFIVGMIGIYWILVFLTI